MTLAEPVGSPGAGLRAWAAAFVVVLAIHAALVGLVLRRPPALSPVEAPPAPVVIDLPPIESTAASAPSRASAPVESVPAPTASAEEVPTEAAEAVAEPQAADAIEPPSDKLTEPTPPTPLETARPTEHAASGPADPATILPLPERPTADPPAALAELPPEPAPEIPDPEALVAAEPAPQAAPKPVPATERRQPLRPPRATRPEPRPAPRAASRTAPPEETRPAAAPAPSRAAAAASAASAGGRPDPSALGRYLAQVRATLERRKTFPPEARAAGARGTATVRFTIDRAGRVLRAALARSAGHPALDAAALDMVRQGGFPAAPDAVPQRTFTISAPVVFAVR